MPANLSNNLVDEAREVKATLAKGAWSGRLLMLVLNYVPLFHAAAVIAVFLAPWRILSLRIALGLGALYLVPPLVVRFIFAVVPIRANTIAVGSAPFFSWWTSFQFQVLFCRFPALEEILRVIPGVYSMWLRLWGSRIGSFTYWSAGTLLTDRSFLCIGNNVVFGAGVRLNGHVISRNTDGQLELLLAPLKVGHWAIVGGYSLLTAGTEISDGEVTRAFLISPPFSVWKNGKRVRGDREGNE